ncbi:class B sortase [Christensenella tenuis]|uniref:Class B sortase n=1 Tax=Christensenella tenuis TaxID=2763033 RepID=A0ABR7EHZ9_9FIRM|nr:class B sortase [Christensenella tenuis]MBC5649410.1 class B sortase [Christensenella tenuis]
MDKRNMSGKNSRNQAPNQSKRAAKGNMKWLIVLAAAIAAAICIVAFAIVPMTREPEPVSTPSPTVIAAPSAEASPSPAPEEPQVLPELEELYRQNGDLAGWVKIEGTVVDYPVMYTPEDGEFYLYRTFQKEEDPTKEGCIFIDKNCSVDPRSTNLLLHGHNMKNGTMFHTLLDYQEEEFYKEHPVIEYSSLYSKDDYEIVSVFLSKVYNKDETDVFKFYKFYDAETEEEFDEFIGNIKELSLYDTGITPEFGDELITLSTCEYTQENGRIAVVARKVTDKTTSEGSIIV